MEKPEKVKRVKIVVFTPQEAACKIREVLGRTGAGVVGNYTFCSFSVKGVGRFKASKNAKPVIGSRNRIVEVSEERIETFCSPEDLKRVVREIKKVHPYEEPIIEIHPVYIFEEALSKIK